MFVPEPLECDACDGEVPAGSARRSETVGDPDPVGWQPPWRPDCRSRLETVSVGDE